MSKKIVIEVCVTSAGAALDAQKSGADRLELCENLPEGGTTPSAGTIAVARKNAGIQLFVLIRPRGGDFLYSDSEFDVMRHDIMTAKTLGADGIVTGILTADGHVDKPRMAGLIALAQPLPVTFHRAFDVAADPFQTLEDCIELKISRILTSGQAKSAVEGADLIAGLVRRAAGRIGILPGCGINANNVRQLVEKTGVDEVHFSAMKTVESAMRFRRTNVPMGGAPQSSEFSVSVADMEKIGNIREIAKARNPPD